MYITGLYSNVRDIADDASTRKTFSHLCDNLNIDLSIERLLLMGRRAG